MGTRKRTVVLHCNCETGSRFQKSDQPCVQFRRASRFGTAGRKIDARFSGWLQLFLKGEKEPLIWWVVRSHFSLLYWRSFPFCISAFGDLAHSRETHLLSPAIWRRALRNSWLPPQPPAGDSHGRIVLLFNSLLNSSAANDSREVKSANPR